MAVAIFTLIICVLLRSTVGTVDTESDEVDAGASVCQDTSTDQKCPAGFTYNGKLQTCFKLNLNKLSWKNAEHACQSLGQRTDLAVVDTADKLSYLSYLLTSQFLSTGVNSTHGTLWVGGLQEQDEGRWLWRTGEEILELWAPGQPNNYLGHQDCVFLVRRLSWQLEDDSCSIQRAYICEYQMN